MKVKFFQGIFLALVLSACVNTITKEYVYQEPKEPKRLPYNFYLDSFLDKRTSVKDKSLMDTLSKREEFPFREDLFVSSLVKKVNGKNYYDYDDATLRVELKDYAAFREKLNYTLSFYVDLTGFDEKGRVLTTGVFSCLVERHEARALLDSLTSFFSHDQDPPKGTKEHKQVWNELYKECLSDIAYQFNNKVVEWGRGRRS